MKDLAVVLFFSLAITSVETSPFQQLAIAQILVIVCSTKRT